MHHANRLPRPVCWCLLLAVLAGGAGVGRAFAQDGPGQPPLIPDGPVAPGVPGVPGGPGMGGAPVGPEVPGRALTVAINNTKTLPIKSGRKAADIRIENPAVARVNVSADARSLLITGLVAGTTKVRVQDEAGEVEIVDVVVQNDIEYLRYILRQAVPTANVDLIPSANNRIIMTGYVSKAEDVPLLVATAGSVVGPQNLVPAVRVGGVMQVQLDVVIASVSRTELREFGFNFQGAGTNGFFSSVFGPQAFNSTATNAAGSITTQLQSTSNLVGGVITPGGNFIAFLDALRTEGLAKFLACPKLVTLSGRPATFLSGGRLAVPEPSGLGTNAVRFEDFGTQLNFLPIVLGNGKIYLEVEPIVNNINVANGTTIGGTAVPGFDTQRVQTAVEMEAGQTFAVGGLIQSANNATMQKVPVLGDIPFLNVFFSTKSFNQTEQELVILVTPHLVDPSTCDQLPKLLPGQETRIPDDFELFLEGIIEAPRGQRQVFDGWHYNAAYKNSPSYEKFPCCVRPCRDYTPGVNCPSGHGPYGQGGCGPDGCGVGGPAHLPAGVIGAGPTPYGPGPVVPGVPTSRNDAVQLPVAARTTTPAVRTVGGLDEVRAGDPQALIPELGAPAPASIGPAFGGGR